MKVLLVEDDIDTAKMIQAVLCSENIICDISEKGESALEIAKIYDYDVIILDILLPDINGQDLLKKFRNARIQSPVLVISGLQSTTERVRALGFGADDFMTKPFDKNEMVARIKAIVRRKEGHSSSVIRVGDLELNIDTKTIKVLPHNINLVLTNKEYEILEFLMLRSGAIVTKNNFINRLYHGLDEPEEKIIDVFICKLRRKLFEYLGHSGRDYIETIWGRGYVLREPLSASNQKENKDPIARVVPTHLHLKDNVIPVHA